MALEHFVDESVYTGSVEEEKGESLSQFTLIIVKPLAMEKGLGPVIIQRLLSEGQSKIESYKLGKQASKPQTADHYADSQYRNGEPTTFYPGLVNYISEKVVDIYVISDSSPAKSDERSFHQRLRQDIIGPSNPEKTEPHHIRNMARFLPYMRKVNIPPEEDVPNSEDALDNLVHCSDSLESAMREVKIWFEEEPEVVARLEAVYAGIIKEEGGVEAN